MMTLCLSSLAFSQIGWFTIVSKGGRYTVSVPSKPTELSVPLSMGDFRGVSHIQNAAENRVIYTASYTDLPIDPTDTTIPEKVFSAAKEDLLAKAHARPLDEKNLDLKGNPGREFKVQGYNGVITSRNYLVKNRLYQLVVIVGDNASAENVGRFFDSFSLVDIDPQSEVPEVISPPPPPPQQTQKPCSGDPPKRVRRSEGVIKGNALHLERPIYPIEARNESVEGKIEVEIVIDEEGNVEEAKAVTGPVLLQQAAVDAAKSSRFKPTTLCGVAIKTEGILTYNFSLR